MFDFSDMEKSFAYSGFTNNTSGFSGLSGGEIAQITASQAPFWTWGGTASTVPGSSMQSAGTNWGQVALIGAGLVLVAVLLKKGR
ncbi:MAG: hypothetical protein U0932_01055 [Thiobacillus sp.]|nr:hypothetical protein [Thiobacillus sp.]